MIHSKWMNCIAATLAADRPQQEKAHTPKKQCRRQRNWSDCKRRAGGAVLERERGGGRTGNVLTRQHTIHMRCSFCRKRGTHTSKRPLMMGCGQKFE